MSGNRPFALSIAGFDPSAGAGVLADVKTFEQHQVYGLAVNTGNTIQTENAFHQMDWTALDFVLSSLKTLFESYAIKAVKIGIVPSLAYLGEVVQEIKKRSPETKIVWDPVLRSTTDFEFTQVENQQQLQAILTMIDLVTPNQHEVRLLASNEEMVESAALSLAVHSAVLLKGGHAAEQPGTDHLYVGGKMFSFHPVTKNVSEKHGSGCVLSSAIAANLALGQDLKSACGNAKKYTEKILASNQTLLAYHHVS